MDQIAAAALRCFVRDGFAATSIADIIAESGLSAGSIYSHFEGKAELLSYAVTVVLTARLDALVARLRAYPAVTPAQTLDELLGTQSQVGDDAAKLLLQVWAQVPYDTHLADVARGAIEAIRTVLHDALAPWAAAEDGRDAYASADAVLAATHGFAVRLVLAPVGDRDELRRSVVRGFAASE